MITKFFRSVGYALKGIRLGIKEERNVRIDIVVMLYVFRFSLFYSFSVLEYALLIFICFAIPAFELMNTAVERAVHKPDHEHYMPAGDAKDAAAGAVLVAAIGAAIAGVLLFWDVAVFEKIWRYYSENLLHIGMLAFSIFAAYFFITIDKYNEKER